MTERGQIAATKPDYAYRHPAASRYLQKVAEALSSVDARELDDILKELSDHLSDATSAGQPLGDVLQALGPAETLARAYAVELAINAPASRLGMIDRALTVVGLLVVASLPSFVVCVVLFAVGVALVGAGVGVLVGGIVAVVRPALVPDLTVSPWLLFLIGPPLAAPGAAAFFALYLYVRFLVRLTRQTLRRVGFTQGAGGARATR